MIRRSSPPRRRSPLASGGPPKKKKRTPDEYARIYGSAARVLFVKSLPCVGCGVASDCENHHVENGGMGRKASYRKIAPLCSPCHRDLHNMGRVAFETCYGVDLRAAAVMTEAKWIAHSVKLSVSETSNLD